MKLFTLIISLFVLSYSLTAQTQSLTRKQEHVVKKLFKKRGEVYFKFDISSRDEINVLTKIISIDNVKGQEVYAYADKEGFIKFLLLGYPYKVMSNPNSLQKVKTTSFKQFQLQSWNTYPTYTAYESIMNQFVTSYPALCKLVNIGTLPSGRKYGY